MQHSRRNVGRHGITLNAKKCRTTVIIIQMCTMVRSEKSLYLQCVLVLYKGLIIKTSNIACCHRSHVQWQFTT